MKKIWDYVSIKSIAVLSTKEVMSIMSGTLFVFHTFFLLLFAYFHIYPLVLMNVGSITLYAICYSQVQKDCDLLKIFNMTYVEVVIYAVVATILLGLDSGFTLYLVILIPIGYYAVYNFGEGDKTVNPMWYILLSGVGFCLTRLICNFIEPIYSYGNTQVARVIYMMNYFVTVVAIIGFFSTLMNQVRILEEMRERQNRSLEQLSKIDPLTGLVNRRCIQEKYQKYKVLNESYAVILGDIDDFKKINDTYGHDAGDKVLMAVAEVFRNTVRCDDIVCRWGGEEILVYLPGCPDEEVSKIAERILGGVRALKVSTSGQMLQNITMTMGIATSDEAYELHLAVQRADDRLYRGKNNGKNTVIWE